MMSERRFFGAVKGQLIDRCCALSALRPKPTTCNLEDAHLALEGLTLLSRNAGLSVSLKTVVLEMAIARLLHESGMHLGNRKIIYISPIKVLSRFVVAWCA